MDSLFIKKWVLQVIQHLEQDKSSGSGDIYPQIMGAVADIIADWLAIPFDMSLKLSRTTTRREVQSLV